MHNIFGTADKPRICVFRSNRYIYAQAIDDEKRATLASYSSLNLKSNDGYQKVKKSQEAKAVGIGLAKILKEKDIKKGVFDRRWYAYGGRVRVLAEGLREGGIAI